MKPLSDKYEPIIGLEVHAQMKTKSKAFCSCSTEFNVPPNTNVCPVCLGHPGTLPVLNKQLVEFILKIGLATNCKITEHSIFARKNYFYPDLPKGYQISQYESPICTNGNIKIDGEKIGITRIHMEEDAGKSIHDFSDKDTLVDLNRCGVPLIEIVSEPDLRSPQEAFKYLTKLKQYVVYLEICDGNMEEGSLRCDANVSVKLKSSEKFGVKTEVKNLNSFKNVTDALICEIERQIHLLENGDTIIHQTLTYDAKSKSTIPMRSKEEAHDYRYFPEPDLVKVYIDDKWLNEIKLSLPELPDKRAERFISEYKLPSYDAEVLTQEKEIADYFEKICNHIKKAELFKNASNWVMSEVLKVLNEKKLQISDFCVKPENISSLIYLIDEGKISRNIAKEIFTEMIKYTDPEDEKQKPEYIIKAKDLHLKKDTNEIEIIVKKIIEENAEETKRYRNGESKLLQFFIGKVMKETKGKADPKVINELLTKNLK